MKISQIIFLILLIVSKISYTQDTIISLAYNKFEKGSKVFIKSIDKQNTVYAFTVNENELIGVKLNTISKSQLDIFESFEKDTREIKNVFFTDTSFIVLLKAKQKNKNSYKYEYVFNQDKAIKTYINIDAFDNIELLSYNLINNDIVFLATDKKASKLLATRINKSLKVHTSEFDIANLISLSGLKKNEFNNEFLAKETPITFDGDKNLFALAKSKKYYIVGDTVFMISGNVGKGVIGIIMLDMANNKASYLGIKRDERSCDVDKKDFLYHSSGYYNNMLVTGKACNHSLDISFYNIFNGSLTKQYSLDATKNNALKNYATQEINFKQNEVTPINNINEDILEKLYCHPFYIACSSVDNNHFLLTTGIYKEKGASTLEVVGSIAYSALSFYNFMVIMQTGFDLEYYIPIGISNRFFSKQAIVDTRFIAAGFNKSTLAEEPEVLKKLNDYDNNPINKKENAISVPFICNGKNAVLQYNKDAESLAIFYLK